MLDVTRALVTALESGHAVVLATVLRTAGSTPQVVGARMLRRHDGSLVGTVGGGSVEHRVIEAMAQLATSGDTHVFALDLGRDLGMCCGGRMEFLIERIEGQPRLLVFGAGHVGAAVAELAPALGFRVTVIDDRDELCNEARLPKAERVLLGPRDAVRTLGLSASDFVLIVTHDHRVDEEALDLCAREPHAYIGMIGSQRKVVKVLDRIEQRAGLPPLAKVYAPVGLPIGGVTPAEIAVSILAELVAVRRGAEVAHMRLVRA